ncbi:hypothetical protein JZ751_023255 [Albula glossodonta]|uniref:Uncharacterized protein n=1 Tax=Albula glossodonta TaxID=121402 RepID=A0A8T2PHP7_9TELE|nr:hypothetical protein JZ751_023255 [Albula glossodonta]
MAGHELADRKWQCFANLDKLNLFHISTSAATQTAGSDPYISRSSCSCLEVGLAITAAKLSLMMMNNVFGHTTLADSSVYGADVQKLTPSVFDARAVTKPGWKWLLAAELNS